MLSRVRTHFVARENEVVDFNAQFKINASDGAIPDSGIIAGNFIHDTRARQTANPVTKIDLVAASHWRIVGNRIADFVKAQGDGISVGAFAKGGGADNRFLRNVVVCEHRLLGLPGQRVGLSLGDGGTALTTAATGAASPSRTRVSSRPISSLRAPTTASISTVLRRAGSSRIRWSTPRASCCASARPAPRSAATWSTARSSRSKGRHCTRGTIATRASRRSTLAGTRCVAFSSMHPRSISPGAAHHRGASHAARPIADLCGVQRPASPTFGAFEDIARCVAQR